MPHSPTPNPLSPEKPRNGRRSGASRSLWFYLHYWIGWIAAIPLILICLTGGILTYEKQLHEWEYPERYDITPSDNPLSIDQVMDLYHAATPKLIVRHLNVPQSPRQAYSAYVTIIENDGGRSGGFVTINQYTGELIRQGEKITLSRIATDLHRNLAVGEVGRHIVAISSLVLALTCIIGLWLWWPMRGKTFSRALKRRRALDWHNALGLVAIVPLIIMALTGALLTYSSLVFPALETLQSAPSAPPDPVVEVAGNGEKLPLSVPLANLRDNFPEGQVTGIQPTGPATAPYTFFVSTENGEYRVSMNPYTGSEISRYDGANSGPISWLRQNYFKFHTLTSFNQAAASLWGLLSMVGAVLAITGIWVSIKRQNRKRRL